MIYSRWRPDRGGYDYFETSERFGIGDDLPTPKLQQVSEIGAASTDAGRPLPAGARRMGSGPLPRGLIAPLSRSGLSGLGGVFDVSVSGVVMLAAGFGIGWVLWRSGWWRRAS